MTRKQDIALLLDKLLKQVEAQGPTNTLVSETVDKLDALLAAQKQRWQIESRIAVYREVEANWHHNDVKKYILDLHENDLRRLAALDGVIGEEKK